MVSKACPTCGALVPEGAAWCPACGGGATLPCPVCGEQVSEDDDYCWSCQTVFRIPSGQSCETCGSLLLRGARFCLGCGLKLEGTSSSGQLEVLICGACESEQPTRRRYCIYCGGRM